MNAAELARSRPESYNSPYMYEAKPHLLLLLLRMITSLANNIIVRPRNNTTRPYYLAKYNFETICSMGKKGKKAQAGKPKKLTAKDIRKRLDALIPMLEEELKGADLFAPLPPTEPFPICLVPLSRFNEKSFYMACCGSHVCQGCDTKGRLFETKQFVASAKREAEFVRMCALCREPIPDDKGYVRQLEALASRKSSPRAARALYNLGTNYLEGDYGMPKDVFRALEYFIQAADRLGRGLL